MNKVYVVFLLIPLITTQSTEPKDDFKKVEPEIKQQEPKDDIKKDKRSSYGELTIQSNGWNHQAVQNTRWSNQGSSLSYGYRTALPAATSYVFVNQIVPDVSPWSGKNVVPIITENGHGPSLKVAHTLNVAHPHPSGRTSVPAVSVDHPLPNVYLVPHQPLPNGQFTNEQAARTPQFLAVPLQQSQSIPVHISEVSSDQNVPDVSVWSRKKVVPIITENVHGPSLEVAHTLNVAHPLPSQKTLVPAVPVGHPLPNVYPVPHHSLSNGQFTNGQVARAPQFLAVSLHQIQPIPEHLSELRSDQVVQQPSLNHPGSVAIQVVRYGQPVPPLAQPLVQSSLQKNGIFIAQQSVHQGRSQSPSDVSSLRYSDAQLIPVNFVHAPLLRAEPGAQLLQHQSPIYNQHQPNYQAVVNQLPQDLKQHSNVLHLGQSQAQIVAKELPVENQNLPQVTPEKHINNVQIVANQPQYPLPQLVQKNDSPSHNVRVLHFVHQPHDQQQQPIIQGVPNQQFVDQSRDQYQHPNDQQADAQQQR